MDFLFIANFSGSKKKDGLLFSFFLYFRVFVSSVQSRSIHWLGSFDLIWFCFFPFFRPRALKKNHLFGVGDEYERGKKKGRKKGKGAGLGRKGAWMKDDRGRRIKTLWNMTATSTHLSLSLFLSLLFFLLFFPIFRSWADLIDNGIEFGRFVWEIKIKRERERERWIGGGNCEDHLWFLHGTVEKSNRSQLAHCWFDSVLRWFVFF